MCLHHLLGQGGRNEACGHFGYKSVICLLPPSRLRWEKVPDAGHLKNLTNVYMGNKNKQRVAPALEILMIHRGQLYG